VNYFVNPERWKSISALALAIFLGTFFAGACIKLWIEYDARLAIEKAQKEIQVEKERREKEWQKERRELQDRREFLARKARKETEARKQRLAIVAETARKQQEIQRKLNATCRFWQNEYSKQRTHSNAVMLKTACNRARMGNPYK
tara:strand:- start:1061 stop:1495 length:435 start_codon:yes stop_codon:yes gene_type:complete